MVRRAFIRIVRAAVLGRHCVYINLSAHPLSSFPRRYSSSLHGVILHLRYPMAGPFLRGEASKYPTQ